MLAESWGFGVSQTWVESLSAEGWLGGKTVGVGGQKGVGAVCVTGLSPRAV